LSALRGKVSGAAAADVVDGSLMLHHAALALELLVEAEDGPLFAGGGVHVSGTAAARGVVVGASVVVSAERGAAGWTSGIFARGDGSWINVRNVASAAPSCVDVVGDGDGWVWLSDAVGGYHFGG
jgi:hypothetical protein